MKQYKTEQEKFWAGEFGDNYIQRNNDKELIAANIALFSKIFARILNITSIIEFGSNIGLNLLAIQQLLPKVELSAIEINASAVQRLQNIQNLSIYHGSILDFIPEKQRDLVFIKGVLIHLNPNVLTEVYTKLYNTSSKYICLAEYYNQTPVEISYRGHEDKLYKRDFAGELMELYPDLKLVDYGFCYHRDPVFTQGDLTWFLLEKRSK